MSQPTFTKDSVKEFANDHANKELAKTYADLAAEALRQKAATVALYKPIFDRYDFRTSNGKPITFEQDRLYRCDDREAVAKYHAELETARKAAGYDLPENCCPFLTANHAVIKHEHLILAALGNLLGQDLSYLSLELREKALQQFMQFVGK